MGKMRCRVCGRETFVPNLNLFSKIHTVHNSYLFNNGTIISSPVRKLNSIWMHLNWIELWGCKFCFNVFVCLWRPGHFGRIAAPSVVGETNDSISLSWNVNTTMRWPRDPTLSLLLQWRYNSQPVGGSWHNLSVASSQTTQSQITVDGLEPYTSYRVQYVRPGGASQRRVWWNMARWSVLICNFLLLQFRLVSVLASDREPLVSEETQPVRTLPYGLPSRPPTNVNAIAVDWSSITISWDAPLFTNGPLVSYELEIQEKPSGYFAIEVRILLARRFQTYANKWRVAHQSTYRLGIVFLWRKHHFYWYLLVVFRTQHALVFTSRLLSKLTIVKIMAR